MTSIIIASIAILVSTCTGTDTYTDSDTNLCLGQDIARMIKNLAWIHLAHNCVRNRSSNLQKCPLYVWVGIQIYCVHWIIPVSVEEGTLCTVHDDAMFGGSKSFILYVNIDASFCILFGRVTSLIEICQTGLEWLGFLFYHFNRAPKVYSEVPHSAHFNYF